MQNEESLFKYIELINNTDSLIGPFANNCLKAMYQLKETPKVIANVDIKDPFINERNYILSLVYQMGRNEVADNQQEGALISVYNTTYFVGGETTKFISLDSDNVKKTCADLDFQITEKGIRTIPDLVIHSSHNPTSGQTGEGQLLALEAKTTNNLGKYPFMKDFFKLNAYLAGLKFQKSIYLIINTSAKKVDAFIEEYVSNGYFLFEKSKDSLFLFIQEGIDNSSQVYKLK